MKLFDKMFNYELQSALIRDGDCREAFPVTSTELEWLKTAMAAGTAGTFLQAKTMGKIESILMPYEAISPEIVEKCVVTNPELVPPVSFKLLRQALREKAGVVLLLVSGKARLEEPSEGWPMLLEFNMARREWYLVWMRLSDRRIRFTALRSIRGVELLSLPDTQSLAAEAEQALEARRLTAVVEMDPAYPTDRHRVLSALSAFDRAVEMGPGDVYRISIRYFQDEEEYLLQRIRFLGLRVRLTEPERLVQRMRDTITRVGAIYDSVDSE